MQKLFEVFTPGGTKQRPTKEQTHLQRPSIAPEERIVLQFHEPRHLANMRLRPAKKRPKQSAALAVEVEPPIISKDKKQFVCQLQFEKNG